MTQQIPIDAFFLDSCLHTFLDTRFNKDDNIILPISYETIDSDFIRPAREKNKLKPSKFSSYTGFIASFYLDNQLEIFGYLTDGILDNFIKLENEIKSGFYEYYVEYNKHLVYCAGKYVDGKSIELPFIWGDEDIITEIDFFEWVRQEVHYVIFSGLLSQRRNCL